MLRRVHTTRPSGRTHRASYLSNVVSPRVSRPRTAEVFSRSPGWTISSTNRPWTTVSSTPSISSNCRLQPRISPSPVRVSREGSGDSTSARRKAEATWSRCVSLSRGRSVSQETPAGSGALIAVSSPGFGKPYVAFVLASIDYVKRTSQTPRAAVLWQDPERGLGEWVERGSSTRRLIAGGGGGPCSTAAPRVEPGDARTRKWAQLRCHHTDRDGSTYRAARQQPGRSRGRARRERRLPGARRGSHVVARPPRARV